MAVIIQDQKTARTLQLLAREQFKLKLLNDVLTDMTICKLEGWDVMEYANELRDLLKSVVHE